MTVFVRDEFDGTVGTLLKDHTPDVDVEGGGWSVLQGPDAAFTLDGNGEVVVAVLSESMAVIDPGVSDFKISGKVTTFGETNNRLIFRAVDANNYWLMFLERFAVGGPIIRKVVAGIKTNVAFFQPPIGPNGAGEVEFEIEAEGDLLTYRDLTNDQLLQAVDSQFQTAKLCGFGDEDSAGSWLIDYTIESIPEESVAVETAAVVCTPSPWLGNPPAADDDDDGAGDFVFFDNFSAPDGTEPDSRSPNIDLPGNGWDQNGELWEINGGQLEYVGPSFATQQITSDIEKSDNIAVQVELTRLPTAAGEETGVVLRFVSFAAAEYIKFTVRHDTDFWVIHANNGGGTLASGTLSTPLAVGDILEIRAVGTAISGFHNGVLLATVNTTSFETATQVGVYLEDEDGTNALFDNFQVTDL